jgi:hypothetical protein
MTPDPVSVLPLYPRFCLPCRGDQWFGMVVATEGFIPAQDITPPQPYHHRAKLITYKNADTDEAE